MTVADLAGVEIGREPELVILPRPDGTFMLTWRVRAATGADVRQYFLDARTGESCSTTAISSRRPRAQSGAAPASSATKRRSA